MEPQEIKLVINRRIRAPLETVYAAWTNPRLMKQWFAPEGMTVPTAEADPRQGGRYLIHMRDDEAGTNHIVSGEYEEVIPDRKLVFNWKWKDGVDRTQVTIELRSHGDNETLLTLTHRGFSQQEFSDKHNEGWKACLDNFAVFLEGDAG